MTITCPKKLNRLLYEARTYWWVEGLLSIKYPNDDTCRISYPHGGLEVWRYAQRGSNRLPGALLRVEFDEKFLVRYAKIFEHYPAWHFQPSEPFEQWLQRGRRC